MSATAMGSRLGIGREAEVYSWGDDAVVKLYWPGFRGQRAEAAVLAELNGRGGAPRLMDEIDHEGRRGLVLERLPGTDMLTAVQRHPWHLTRLSRQLAGAHRRIHQVEAPNALPDLREVMAARIEHASMPTPLRDFALQTLETLPAGDRLCHGDFHPGNVLVDRDKMGVIDWPNAARGVPEAGHARTLLLLRWADPLPGTPPLVRSILATGRALFARSYARAYRRGSSETLHGVRSWLTANLAARMSEGIEVEQSRLLGLLEQAHRTRLWPRSSASCQRH